MPLYCESVSTHGTEKQQEKKAEVHVTLDPCSTMWRKNWLLSSIFKAVRPFQGFWHFYHLRWEINESCTLSFFVTFWWHQVFTPAAMNWASLISVPGYPFCMKKRTSISVRNLLSCAISQFLKLPLWKDVLEKYSHFSDLGWITKKLAVSLTPVNELNNYTSQGMKNDFLKGFVLNQR